MAVTASSPPSAAIHARITFDGLLDPGTFAVRRGPEAPTDAGSIAWRTVSAPHAGQRFACVGTIAEQAAQVRLPANSMLSFRLETPLTVVPSSTLLKNAGRKLGTIRPGVDNG